MQRLTKRPATAAGPSGRSRREGDTDVRVIAAIRNCCVGLWIRPRSADAERRLAAVEDERNDQILLVAEVLRQQAQQGIALPGIALARAAQRLVVDGGAQEGVGR